MHTILLWIHFGSIAAGGAGAFGLPLLGAVLGSAPAEARGSLAIAARRVAMLSRAALVVLILSGLALVQIGPGFGGVGGWFWIKMLLVAGLIAGIIIGSRLGAKAQAGDAAAKGKAKLTGIANIGLLLGIILAALLEFG